MAVDVKKCIEEIRQDFENKPIDYKKSIMLAPLEVSELRRALPNYNFMNGEKHDYHQGNNQTLYHITKKVMRKRNPFHLHPRPVMKPRGSGGLGSRLKWPDRGIK